MLIHFVQLGLDRGHAKVQLRAPIHTVHLELGTVGL
jgi:hypothetical protein